MRSIDKQAVQSEHSLLQMGDDYFESKCFLQQFSMKSEVEHDSRSLPVILIYYNFKGIGQIVRYLLCYLQIPFIDILLDEYQKQRETLPREILQALRSKSINKNDLPGILHNNQIIYELNQVMNYLCITFNREDLLGVDIYQKARVCQVQELYSTRLATNIRFMSGFVSEVHQTSLEGVSLLGFIEAKMTQIFRESGYFRELSDYLRFQQNQHFVFGNITVVDFYFIETSKFAVGLFSNIDEHLAQKNWTETAKDYRIRKQSQGKCVNFVQNLRAMRRYIDYCLSQPFYMENQVYLESFSQFPRSMSGAQKQGMKKLETNYFLDLYYNG